MDERAKLTRHDTDNINVTKRVTMMTWKEFERANTEKAFEVATRICQERRDKANAWDNSYNAIYTADLAAEMNLILSEWYDDYKWEHV